MASQNEVNDLFARYQIARTRADLWQTLLNEAYSYAIPNRNTLQGGNADTIIVPGERLAAQVFDTTAMHAVAKFTSKMHSILTPSFVQWAKLTTPALIQEERPDIADKLNQQLAAVTDVLFRFINQSNFDLAINESYFDLSIGTASITIREGDDDNPLIFDAVPISHIFPEPGPHGTIETVWRLFEQLSARNIMRMWPEAKLSDEMRQKVTANSNTEFDLVEGTIWDNDKKKFHYILIEANTRTVLVENFSDSSPWVVFRWSVLPGEVYGRGPVINALPSIRSLNTMARFELQAANLAIAPPLAIDMTSGINPNNIRLEPYAIWPLNMIPGGGPAVQPLQLGGEVRFGQLLASDLRNQINSLMFGDPLGPVQQPVRTATEISIRQQNLAEEIGPAFGRLEVELLSKIIDRCMFILRKKGMLPDIEIDGHQVELKYQSPLAKSQDSSEVQALEQVNQILQSFVGPQLSAAAFNMEQLPEWLADKLGADINLVKNPQEIQQNAQQVQQAAEQQQPQLGEQVAQPGQQSGTGQ